jgi:uracil phosphoribosyltransferase
LGEATEKVLADEVIIASVLRAGLPMHNGILNYFDNADNAFISAYRKHHKDGSFEIEVEYISSPSLDGRILILSDPMLATGQSMVLSLEALLTKGNPIKIVVMAAIASSEGVEYIQSHLPENSEIYVGAIDNEMTAQAYIVPGLGDAGDLAFGPKL